MSASNNVNGTADSLDPGTDGPTQLNHLLEQVQSRASRAAQPAASLCIEVDGEVVALADDWQVPTLFALPADSRSLTLRDEHGTARAHILLQEQEIDRVHFDEGRLLLSVSRTSRAMHLVLCDGNEAP